MAIPDFQALMLPLLEALADGQEHATRDLNDQLADHFKLTEDERQQRMPSGDNKVFINRVGWAKARLKAAGLIENPARGTVSLSAEGRKVLDQKPATIDLAFLKRLNPDGLALPLDPVSPVDANRTPHEQIATAYKALRKATADELLSLLRARSPAFFEKAVVQLLLAMGYGGASGKGLVTGRTGDGGIDGIITEDKLGLDVVCVQAKRWEATVGRPDVQQFAGSMDSHHARKGVFLTTSGFSHEAKDCAKHIEGKKIVLIDGERLADLMIEHDVGVVTPPGGVYKVKEVSNDFFDEDEG